MEFSWSLAVPMVASLLQLHKRNAECKSEPCIGLSTCPLFQERPYLTFLPTELGCTEPDLDSVLLNTLIELDRATALVAVTPAL